MKDYKSLQNPISSSVAGPSLDIKERIVDLILAPSNKTDTTQIEDITMIKIMVNGMETSRGNKVTIPRMTSSAMECRVWTLEDRPREVIKGNPNSPEATVINLEVIIMIAEWQGTTQRDDKEVMEMDEVREVVGDINVEDIMMQARELIGRKVKGVWQNTGR